MKEECEHLLENGLARPSHSPWSSPCLLAPKSDVVVFWLTLQVTYGGECCIGGLFIYLTSHFLCTFDLYG